MCQHVPAAIWMSLKEFGARFKLQEIVLDKGEETMRVWLMRAVWRRCPKPGTPTPEAKAFQHWDIKWREDLKKTRLQQKTAKHVQGTTCTPTNLCKFWRGAYMVLPAPNRKTEEGLTRNDQAGIPLIYPIALICKQSTSANRQQSVQRPGDIHTDLLEKIQQTYLEIRNLTEEIVQKKQYRTFGDRWKKELENERKSWKKERRLLRSDATTQGGRISNIEEPHRIPRDTL